MTNEDRQLLALERIKLFRAEHGSAAPLPDEIVALLSENTGPHRRRQPMSVGQFVVAVLGLALLVLIVFGMRDSSKEAGQATVELNQAIQDADNSLAEADRLLGKSPTSR